MNGLRINGVLYDRKLYMLNQLNMLALSQMYNNLIESTIQSDMPDMPVDDRNLGVF